MKGFLSALPLQKQKYKRILKKKQRCVPFLFTIKMRMFLKNNLRGLQKFDVKQFKILLFIEITVNCGRIHFYTHDALRI